VSGQVSTSRLNRRHVDAARRSGCRPLHRRSAGRHHCRPPVTRRRGARGSAPWVLANTPLQLYLTTGRDRCCCMAVLVAAPWPARPDCASCGRPDIGQRGVGWLWFRSCLPVRPWGVARNMTAISAIPSNKTGAPYSSRDRARQFQAVGYCGRASAASVRRPAVAVAGSLVLVAAAAVGCATTGFSVRRRHGRRRMVHGLRVA
jgi:hypothetical protein